VTVAALYVDPAGIYAGKADCWGPDRDARTYDGPHPVVAHPPCTRWCRLAGLVEARWGHKKGDDGGTFAAALASVRRWGGVLEHPAYTDAFKAYDIPAPPWSGWQRTLDGGWVAHVEQGRYGHLAKKATWLYAFGIDDPPALRWGRMADTETEAHYGTSWCANKTKAGGEARLRVGKAAAATPPEFAELLLSIAAVAGGGS